MMIYHQIQFDCKRIFGYEDIAETAVLFSFRLSFKKPNLAERLLFKACKDQVSPLLRTLHWLPIQAPTEYTLSTLWYFIFSHTAPACQIVVVDLKKKSETKLTVCILKQDPNTQSCSNTS